MIKLNEAIRYAIDAGATESEIESETKRQERQVGSVPFNNMIKALNMMTNCNTKDDWTRLAGALQARKNKRSR